MRDILLRLIVAGILPFTLKKPYIGPLLWIWLGIMNPHRLTYGFAYNLPFAQISAVLFLSWHPAEHKKLISILSLSYFDLPYYLLLILVVLKGIVRDETPSKPTVQKKPSPAFEQQLQAN